jgi:hypothetical protein
MEIIEMKVELANPIYFEKILDHFVDKSPIFPIIIQSNYWHDVLTNKKLDTIGDPQYPYEIIRSRPDEPDGTMYEPLARIGIEKYPSVVVVSIEGYEELKVGDWEDVINMARHIQSRAEELGMKLKVKPDINVSPNGPKPWGIKKSPSTKDNLKYPKVQLPKFEGRKKVWKRTSLLIREQREHHMSLDEISSYIKKQPMLKNLPYDPDTLSKIERADKAGQLEDIK